MCAHVSTFVQSDRLKTDTGRHQMGVSTTSKPINSGTAAQNKTHKSAHIQEHFSVCFQQTESHHIWVIMPQEEGGVCQKPSLQGALLPAHCANADDIVAMHYSQEQ